MTKRSFIVHNFRELKVWHKAREMVRDVYLLTKIFPKEELFGLTIQMRRSAVSIPSDIAEGCGRGSDAQLAHFLDIAQGSSCELETQLLLSLDLNFVDESRLAALLEKTTEIQKMIRGLKNSLNP